LAQHLRRCFLTALLVERLTIWIEQGVSVVEADGLPDGGCVEFCEDESHVFDGAETTGHSAVTDECNGLGEPFLAGEVDEVKIEDAGVLDLLCEPTCDGRPESTLSRWR
jgi:hypothetical protein